MKILLHCCCGPCAAGCVERLIEEYGRKNVLLYFANSNLCDRAEYEKRLDALRQLAGGFELPLETDDYNHSEYLRRVSGLEGEKEGGKRCEKCFEFSLERSSLAAEKFGIEKFCTSLTVSPHKNSALLEKIGGKFDNFAFYNFKKKGGFLRGIEIARENGLYRQNFCGCEFSRRPPAAETGNGLTPETGETEREK